MDVDDEWELLSDEGFLQITDNGGGDQIIYPAVFHTNYFICPEFVESTSPPILIEEEEEEEEERLDQDPAVSQVFFKKMEEAEFVDMKVESPKPSAAVPQIEGEKEVRMGGDNVWKWNLGAICSFGVAAATFCIVVLTNNKKNPHHHHHHNHNLRFRLYSQDKRMKAVSGVPVTRARITVGGYYDASPTNPVMG